MNHTCVMYMLLSQVFKRTDKLRIHCETSYTHQMSLEALPTFPVLQAKFANIDAW
jgi:hypothetical protein